MTLKLRKAPSHSLATNERAICFTVVKRYKSMEKNQNGLFGVNIFAKAFQEFDEEAFFENLHNQVRNKSYFEKYKGFKNTLLILSYVFNASSALTASYAVYWLTQWITGIAILGYVVAAIFLFFLEKIKRKSSTEFWQVFFFQKQFAVGWCALSLFCLALSLASSGFGVKEGTETLSADASLVASDSLATAYRIEITTLTADNERLKKQTNHEGIIYFPSQQSIKKNTTMIQKYQQRILELDEKLIDKNEVLSEDYIKDVQLTAWTLVWITILMELLFESCIAYIWYYFFRSYVERKHFSTETSKRFNAKALKTNQPDSPPPTEEPSKEDLLMYIELLKDQNKTLRAKQNGQDDVIPASEEESSPKGFYGSKNNGSGNSIPSRNPIGFFLKEKSTIINELLPNSEEKSHQEAWTGLDRAIQDAFTVPHSYKRANELITVHYTMRMVRSRINQYQREIQEALDKEMNNTVLKNRQQWLVYWQGKEKELFRKTAAAIQG